MEYAQYLKSGESAVKSHCDHLREHLGMNTFLDNITDDFIAKMKQKLRADLSNSTINRVLSTLRKMLSMAKHEWDYAVPEITISRHMLAEPECRIRWITADQANLLIDKATAHLKDPIRFALLTGLRLSNIVGLQWQDVNLKDRVIYSRVKSSLPGGKLHETAISQPVTELLLRNDPKPNGHVFLRRFKADQKTGIARKPEPIKKFRRSFAHACKEAGIADFRFHDLRHTAASWMRQNGVPIEVVQKVLGHKDIQTTMKYAHLHDDEKAQALDTLALAQSGHIKKNRRAS